MSSKIYEIWNELKNEEVVDKPPFLVRDFKKSTHDNPVRFTIARSFPENDYGILLEADKEFFLEDIETPNFENFEIKYIANRQSKNYIWFFLKKNSEFEKQFELICLDIIETSIGAKTQKACILNFINGIRIWQELLKEKKSELGTNALKGLFAELYFINEILIPKFGEKKAVHFWKPNNKTHDFVSDQITIEIKATTISPIRSVSINSLKQLDETLTKKLRLYILQIGENKGTSVPELIDQIKLKIKNNSPDDLYLFERKLFKEKYNDIFRDKYIKKTFFKNNEHVFEIKDDFPRLRETDLIKIDRKGIISAKYDINLQACEHYKITMDKFIKSL
jgi:hypothetical protein